MRKELDDIDAGNAVPLNSDSKKPKADFDKDDWIRQKIRRLSEDTDHRKGLITWVKYVVILWLACVVVIVAANSFTFFDLSDGVLIALLTTTTVNILGLAYIVLQGLFKIKD